MSFNFNQTSEVERHVERIDGALACLSSIHFGDETEAKAVTTLVLLMAESRNALRKVVNEALRDQRHSATLNGGCAHE